MADLLITQSAIDLWQGFGAETKGAIITGAATIGAAAVGALAIIWQLRHQGRLNRESIKENERRRIKAQTYEQIAAACERFSDAQAVFVAAVMGAAGELKIAAELNAENQPSPIPRARIMKLNAMCSELQTALTSFLAIIEQSKAVDPRTDIFATAFSCAHDGVMDSFQKNFFPYAMRLLPVERGNGGGIFPYRPPSLDQAKEAWRLATIVIDRVHDATGYALDLSVEMQNLLVADLFGTKVAHREPIDPAIKVIRLENYDELHRYFHEDTAWGQRLAAERAALIARARQ